MIEGYFDGACEPRNPGGHAAYGAILLVDGVIVFQHSKYLGAGPKMSNNVAEYAAVCIILNEIRRREGPATVYGDSQLVINQLNGKWNVKDGLYLPYYKMAAKLLEQVKLRVTLEWIPGEKNKLLDALSKYTLP